MMYSWCLVLAFYPCIADEGSFSLGVYILLSAGFIAGDGDELLLLLLLLLHWMSVSGEGAFGVWPSLFTQDRPSRGEIKARSRDAHQAAVESDLLIKKKLIN